MTLEIQMWRRWLVIYVCTQCPSVLILVSLPAFATSCNFRRFQGRRKLHSQVFSTSWKILPWSSSKLLSIPLTVLAQSLHKIFFCFQAMNALIEDIFVRFCAAIHPPHLCCFTFYSWNSDSDLVILFPSFTLCRLPSRCCIF